MRFTRRTLCVSLAVFVVATVGPVATAAVKPDLTVTDVGAVPPSATKGSTFEISYAVKNAGTAKAGASTTGFWLSADRKRGTGDVKIGSARTAGVRPRRFARGDATVKMPTSVAPSAYYVVACADAARKVRESKETNNCRSSSTKVQAVAPSSVELIDRDLAAGKITEEQALVYNVFATFSDPRLPAKYDAPPTGLEDSALDDVAAQWGSLSEETQATLRPFLIPPFYAGSHWSPEAPSGRRVAAQQVESGGSPWCLGSTDVQPLFTSWNHIDSADGTLRIWWDASNTADATTATDLMSVFESKIQPALTSLMGRAPKSDGGGLCNGGSGALDVALVDAKTATTYADTPACAGTTSAHMVFPRTAGSAGWAGLAPYFAHEYMHAIQYNFPLAGSCTSYAWLREATAEWVQDYVTDPTYGIGVAPDDTEFQAARIYMKAPEVSLDVESPPANHDYGSYLLPFYVVRNSGPGFIKDVWTNAGSKPALEAVEAALPGGSFDGLWGDFALANWNFGPVKDYRDWDGLTASPKLAAEGTVPVDAGLEVATDIPYLAAKYYRFDFQSGVKTIYFANPFAGQDHVSVRAVLTMADGSQRIEDWTDKDVIKFCRDLDNENVREVTVIVANENIDKSITLSDPLFVQGEKLGCVCKPTGTMARAAEQSDGGCPGLTGTYTWTHNSSFSSSTGHGNSNGNLTLTLNLPPVPDDPDSPGVDGQYLWEGTEGSSVSYNSTSYGFGDDGSCTLETEETYTGGDIVDARASTDEEGKTLWVDVTYTWEWSKTITYGGACAWLGTTTGTDSGTSDIFIMAEGSGDGTWTYHAEYSGPNSSTTENGTFSRG